MHITNSEYSLDQVRCLQTTTFTSPFSYLYAKAETFDVTELVQLILNFSLADWEKFPTPELYDVDLSQSTRVTNYEDLINLASIVDRFLQFGIQYTFENLDEALIQIQHYDLKRYAIEEDYFKILGIGYDINDRDLKKRYRELSTKFHPDNLTTGDRERFVTISNAYQALKNPENRNKYKLKLSGRLQDYLQNPQVKNSILLALEEFVYLGVVKAPNTKLYDFWVSCMRYSLGTSLKLFAEQEKVQKHFTSIRTSFIKFHTSKQLEIQKEIACLEAKGYSNQEAKAITDPLSLVSLQSDVINQITFEEFLLYINPKTYVQYCKHNAAFAKFALDSLQSI
jgi:curved DNA-binding protein CbpA